MIKFISWNVNGIRAAIRKGFMDFVDEYSVKSVLGVGGGYMGNPTFFNIVIFLRESIPKKIAEHFMLHASKFKASTINHVENAKIFTFENKE